MDQKVPVIASCAPGLVCFVFVLWKSKVTGLVCMESRKSGTKVVFQTLPPLPRWE